MGLRGPRKKPAHLKALAGNPGRRPIQGMRSHSVRKGIPCRPTELTGEAAAEWDRLVPDLHAAGLLAVVDRGVLSAYCLAFADMLAARNEINQAGRFVQEIVQNARGEHLGTRIKEHPAVKMLEKASERLRKLARELGLTPDCRVKLEGSETPAPPAANPILALRAKIEAATIKAVASGAAN